VRPVLLLTMLMPGRCHGARRGGASERDIQMVAQELATCKEQDISFLCARMKSLLESAVEAPACSPNHGEGRCSGEDRNLPDVRWEQQFSVDAEAMNIIISESYLVRERGARQEVRHSAAPFGP
jgi:hypothetical protein